MLTEEGVIRRVAGQKAWVLTQRSSMCDACHAQGACKALGSGKEVEVLAINQARARVGDRVLLSLEGPSLLKASFLIYLLPLFALVLGAVLGSWLSSYFSMDPDLTAVVFAGILFAPTLYLVRRKGRSMGQKQEYLPQVIKVISSGGKHALE